MLRFERDSLELYDLIEELRECDAPGLFFVFFGGSAGQLTDRLEYEKFLACCSVWLYNTFL